MNRIKIERENSKAARRLMNTSKRTRAGLAPKYKGVLHKHIYNGAKKLAIAKLQLAKLLIA